jgi:pyridoxamine 5'-phosphate oxidase
MSSPLPPPSPWPEFSAWYAEAARAEPDVPDAMQVASIGADGRPSLRTVLLKDHDETGIVFYTNTHSRKGRELLAHPAATALFHWKSLQRQAIFEGDVTPTTPAEADAYFATRPRGSQLGAWASQQSEPMADRAELEARLAKVTARFDGAPVPRPPHWSGFRLAPHRVELWQGRADRLHERREWTRDGEGWRFRLLQP